MESIVNCQLLRYLEGHQLISDYQYGFRRGRSAGDLLVYLTHRWAEAIESKGEALALSGRSEHQGRHRRSMFRPKTRKRWGPTRLCSA
ncbi:unnamed protein product [Pieris macdunnoughi]|uniref:Reverse transcriptase domain-containing protein n=1 Tax=Pieris macdunnoughi TaxID=345717 RepID=A0A821V0S4_9NEOP|nr:unnamed protein product [Pieris macdunnoughi]